jgi:hypothetical protein
VLCQSLLQLLVVPLHICLVFPALMHHELRLETVLLDALQLLLYLVLPVPEEKGLHALALIG